MRPATGTAIAQIFTAKSLSGALALHRSGLPPAWRLYDIFIPVRWSAALQYPCLKSVKTPPDFRNADYTPPKTNELLNRTFLAKDCCCCRCGGCLAAVRGLCPTTITGAGAAFPVPDLRQGGPIIQKESTNVAMNYQSIGSGGGIKADPVKTVDFGARPTCPLGSKGGRIWPGTVWCSSRRSSAVWCR